MFEQAFKNIDDILRKEAGCTTELDYTEQTSWLLFLKYLDGLEQDKAMVDELRFRSQTEKHELSHLYEAKIRNMGNAGRNGGEYYTPRPLIRAIIQVVQPRIGERIYDGACGSAGFLCESFDYLKAKGGLTTGDELLLCVRGATGLVSVASEELEGANVTRGIVPIRFDQSRISQQFGYYVLSSLPFQDQIREKTYGAALMQINIRDLRNIVLSFPPLNEQEKIVANLNALSTETQRLESIYQQKLAVLDELKRSLLHQAFTGQL